MTVAHLEALIVERLIEAQVCMKRMQVRNTRPGLPSTFWPDTELDPNERWEVVLERLKKGIPVDDPVRSRPAPPSAAAISRMEETWDWMAGIKDERIRKAVAIKVFGWVHNVSTSSLASAMGINRVTLNRRFNAGVEQLMVSLCKESVFPDSADGDLVHHFRPNQAIRNRNIAANAA